MHEREMALTRISKCDMQALEKALGSMLFKVQVMHNRSNHA